MKRSSAVLAVGVILSLALPALAQDAEKGKEYEITIESEQDNQYTGPYGQSNIGKVVVMVPNAKKAEKYKIKVTDVQQNQYTGDRQASCDFEQIGGSARKGMCLGAP